MRVLIVTDAWRPQVNGVVRTLERLKLDAEHYGVDIDFITPAHYPSTPLPGYPEFRLALTPPQAVSDAIEAHNPDALHIATEGPLGWMARHAALRMDTVKQSLQQRFGNDILNESGEIRRDVLAQRVFGDSEGQKTARRDLEKIVHPAIEQQIVDAIADGVKQGCQGVLLDAAVLLEAGWRHRCDAVVFVDAPDAVRERRVAARNGWSLSELQRREASQLGLDEKRNQSDVVISNEADDDRGGRELLDFLLRNWGICCKPLSNSSQQS